MPRKLIARNVAIVVTPGTRNADGTFAWGTALTVTGRAGSASITRKLETERVEADDADAADREWTKRDWTVMAEAVKYNAATGDLLDLVDSYEYFRIAFTFQRGGGTRTETYIGVYTEAPWEKQVGRNTDRIAIDRVDTGSANPTIS